MGCLGDKSGVCRLIVLGGRGGFKGDLKNEVSTSPAGQGPDNLA